MQEWLGGEKVSCLERCPQFRGVLIERFHCSYNVSFRKTPSFFMAHPHTHTHTHTHTHIYTGGETK